MPRSLKRIFVSSPLKGQIITLSSEEAHYVSHVLRMKPGSLVQLFDASGTECLARLSERKGKAEVVPGGRPKRATSYIPPGCPQGGPFGSAFVSVAQAIPQHRKMDTIVEKACELGVQALIPIVTERTVVRMAQERAQKAHERWQRIAQQTLQQSKLAQAPEIRQPIELSRFQEDLKHFKHVFVLHPGDQARRVQEAMGQVNGNEPILLLIGPEGGFSDSEIEALKTQGATPVRLASGILKTDTAFVAAVSAFQSHLGV